jgi:hypothetical protein
MKVLTIMYEQTIGSITANLEDAFKTIEEKAGPDAKELKELIQAIVKEFEEGKVPKGLLEKAKGFFSNYEWVHSTLLNLMIKVINALLSNPGYLMSRGLSVLWNLLYPW